MCRLQPRVLSFGALQDRDISVSILPQCQECFIGSLGPGPISRQNEHPTELQVRQHADGIGAYDTGMIENLLEFGRRVGVPSRGHQGLAAHVG